METKKQSILMLTRLRCDTVAFVTGVFRNPQGDYHSIARTRHPNPRPGDISRLSFSHSIIARGHSVTEFGYSLIM